MRLDLSFSVKDVINSPAYYHQIESLWRLTPAASLHKLGFVMRSIAPNVSDTFILGAMQGCIVTVTSFPSSTLAWVQLSVMTSHLVMTPSLAFWLMWHTMSHTASSTLSGEMMFCVLCALMEWYLSYFLFLLTITKEHPPSAGFVRNSLNLIGKKTSKLLKSCWV